MNRLRRTLLGALAVWLAKPLAALAAWNESAFGAKTPQDALKGIGAANPVPSKDIVIDAPQIAENGAVVPIEITSNIPGTSSLAVVLEKNPFPLAARFEFKEGALPHVKLNVKMAETADVRVVAAAGGRHYSATREVKVTIGGCGG
jgi:sulfur-oxidizing protein SoxY